MNIAEQLKSLLPDVEISEDFVTRLTASIETAVAQRVEEQTKEINKKAEEDLAAVQSEIKEITDKANAYAEYVMEEMTKKVDDYCEFVIEQFVEENRKKLVETEEYCRMAATLNTIREAFETNYFQLNSEPANLETQEKLAESKKDFNELFAQHRELKNQIEEYSQYVETENRKAIFETATKDLAESQKEKVQRLVEKSSFPDRATFEIGLQMMVEEFKAPRQAQSVLKESATASATVVPIISPSEKMSTYLSKL
jgi:uncharacterized protein YdiU (UPF0061 family)